MGRDVAIDASDMPAYGNGQRFLSKDGPERERFSDPDASWGHRSAISVRKGGGFYGYRIHAAVCAWGLLVQANTAGPSGRVVVPRPLLRPSPQESRPGRMDANAGRDALTRSLSPPRCFCRRTQINPCFFQSVSSANSASTQTASFSKNPRRAETGIVK